MLFYIMLAVHQGLKKKEEKRGKLFSRKGGLRMKKEEKRGVLFSAFKPIRSIRAEVKMRCSRQLVDSV